LLFRGETDHGLKAAKYRSADRGFQIFYKIKNETKSRFMNETLKDSVAAVLDPKIPFVHYCEIDLSSSNKDLESVNVASSQDWENYIDAYLLERNMQVAYGGYLEKRNIYNRSDYFNNSDVDRNIHLGVDFWAPEKTSVHAVLDGTIHSFQNNDNFGDYGPTIILEHEFDGETFYSLYGHLSLKSLESITLGQKIGAGDQIGWLGDASVNGDYAPHLHFQLILNLEGKKGDYPGVCSSEKMNWYAENCPNPLELFDLK